MSLTLPSPTKFGKHLALRFQLTRQSAAGARWQDRGGDGSAYRIVQVPLSYSFRTLRLLLVFLFDGPDAVPLVDADSRRSDMVSTEKGLWKRVAGRVVRRKKVKKEGKKDEAWPGHLFEIKRDIVMMHKTRHRRGEMDVQKSRTWAKLSSVRDPYRFRDPPPGVEGDDGTVFDNPDDLPAVEEPGEPSEDGVEWRWEAEEHMTLARAWPAGPELTRGVVYVRLQTPVPFAFSSADIRCPQHHDPHTQVHITVNTLPVTRRRGSGNTPFVFVAKGRLGLEGGAAAAEKGDWKEDMSVEMWNRPNAFETFLARLRGTSDVDASYPVEDVQAQSVSVCSLFVDDDVLLIVLFGRVHPWRRYRSRHQRSPRAHRFRSRLPGRTRMPSTHRSRPAQLTRFTGFVWTTHRSG